MNTRVCRTCQSEKGLVNIFHEGNKHLIPKLLRVTNIAVREEDCLPKLICSSCQYRLQEAHDFVEECHKTDRILRNRIHKFGVTFVDDIYPIKYDTDNEDFDDVPAADCSPKETKIFFDDEKPDLEAIHLQTTDNLITQCAGHSDDEKMVFKVEPMEEILLEPVKDPIEPYVIAPKYENQENMALKESDADEEEYNFSLDDARNDEDYVPEDSVDKSSVTSQPELAQTVKKPRKKRKCKPRDESRYTCQVCQKVFQTTYKLRVHSNIHDGVKFPCHLCNKQCSNRVNMLRHIRQVHENIRPHACEICGSSFHRPDILKQHMVTHQHEKNFPCTECDKRFKSALSLRQHARFHQPDFDIEEHQGKRNLRSQYQLLICETCGKQCNTRSNYEQHKKVHSEDRPFECSLCPMKYKTKVSLNNHKLAHTNEKPFTCDICSKTFRETGGLRLHKRAVHDPVSSRQFGCKFCDRRLINIHALVAHERAHTGEKPYRCDECEMSFITKGVLKKHQKKYHSNARESGVLFKDDQNLAGIMKAEAE